MQGIALGLASSLSWGISDFLGGLQTRRMSVLAVMLVVQPVGFAIAFAAAIGLGHDSLSTGQVVTSVAAGIGGEAALACFYLAMAGGPMSVVAPIAAMDAIVPVSIGLARGESPAPLQLAGLTVAVVGVLLAVREPDHPDAASIARRTVLLAALAALGFGLFFVGMDSAANADALWATAYARIGGLVGIIGAVAFVAARGGPSLAPPSRAVPILVLIGAMDVLATGLFGFASRDGLLSLVAVSASIYPVFSVLLARYVLNERIAPSQQAGVGIALAGVALIAAGG